MLVVFAVLAGDAPWTAANLRAAIQRAIAARLNPLFKVHDVVLVDALPRTASNKVMRRELRADYEKRTSSPGVGHSRFSSTKTIAPEHEARDQRH